MTKISTVRLVPMRSPEQLLVEWEAASKECPLVLTYGEHSNFMKAMDIACAIEDNRLSGHEKSKITVMDHDILLKDGVKSPLDQKTYFTNRQRWKDHLKANGCVEIGNDFNDAKPRTEVRGDFDCRKELSQAVYQVMEKHGH